MDEDIFENDGIEIPELFDKDLESNFIEVNETDDGEPQVDPDESSPDSNVSKEVSALDEMFPEEELDEDDEENPEDTQQQKDKKKSEKQTKPDEKKPDETKPDEEQEVDVVTFLSTNGVIDLDEGEQVPEDISSFIVETYIYLACGCYVWDFDIRNNI